MTTSTTWQLSPNSATTKTNPHLPVAVAVHECDDWHDGYCSVCCRALQCLACAEAAAPRFHDVTDPGEYVAALAGAVASEHPQPAVDFHDPRLTRGQAQVLRAETPRLFRLLGDRRPRSLVALLVLLEDLAEQAPAVDDALALEDERRRNADAARPRLTGMLTKRAQS